jgi:hypothetical protein
MFTGKEIHRIPLDEAADLTRTYRASIQDATVTGIKGGYFSKDEVAALLNQPDCVGFRYYYGLDAAGIKVLVLVGVNKDENDLVTGLVLERAIPCPNQCGDANDLNS